MGNFQNILKALRKAKGLTQDELAKRLEISRSTIGMYEKGAREPDFETLTLIADYFNVDVDFLLGRTNKTTYIPHAAPVTKKGTTIKILGHVAAGIPIEAIEDVIDEEEIPEELAKTGEFFGLKINGNSMEPDIHDGDTVIVRKQDDAESDEIVIALVNGNDGVCKRLKKYADSIALISLNPSYEPMFFSQEEIDNKPVRIVGKVVELRRKF
ncbi:MAG: helix-turn-helix domain-containing protein [Coprococcus catus]|nr:helix-turn-helix domain-containing protein [Coprococcus catus]